ncbi:dethiobiotin synthase [Nocardioides jensenii]|uniref:dethiobiotin synthase n=1 Tax=Nocardioides jensenii TaxID=1843 RepID=UPI00082C2AC7|nr:dethiobiotin synthase [Nocardioides jensenii]
MSGRIVVVTGTDTGVGKTIATAALAVRIRHDGHDHDQVTVVKPVQTGIDPQAPCDPADATEVHRLTGCRVHEFTCLAAPLAPDTAARIQGTRLPVVAEHAARIRELARRHRTVIVEGAGGVLVRLDAEGGTVLDLAEQLDAEVYVVSRAGLGTLNHTELTVDALRARGLEPTGLVIGAWPDAPGLAERTNREDLPRVTGVPVLGVLPQGAGALGREAFCAAAPDWFTDAP